MPFCRGHTDDMQQLDVSHCTKQPISDPCFSTCMSELKQTTESWLLSALWHTKLSGLCKSSTVQLVNCQENLYRHCQHQGQLLRRPGRQLHSAITIFCREACSPCCTFEVSNLTAEVFSFCKPLYLNAQAASLHWLNPEPNPEPNYRHGRSESASRQPNTADRDKSHETSARDHARRGGSAELGHAESDRASDRGRHDTDTDRRQGGRGMDSRTGDRDVASRHDGESGIEDRSHSRRYDNTCILLCN